MKLSNVIMKGRYVNEKGRLVNSMERLMTADEVCELLNVKKRQLYQLTFRKKIPFIKVLGGLRFNKLDLENWVKANTILPQSQLQLLKSTRTRQKKIGHKNNSAIDSMIDKIVERAKAELIRN